MANEPGQFELRRHLRTRVTWPAIVEADSRHLHVDTLDVGPYGAKVRLEGIDERLEEGTLATLHLTPPGCHPVDVQTIVWRTDDDGSVLFFIKATPPASVPVPITEP